MKPLQNNFSSYVPNLIIQRLQTIPTVVAPSVENFPAAALFADISGFTRLTERLSQLAPSGVEALTQILNAYFDQLIELITNHGGDIVKFTGDGLLALWPAENETLATATLRAVQCGLAIQIVMTPNAWSIIGHNQEVLLQLRVRLGVDSGTITMMHLGGFQGQWELFFCGPPLRQMDILQQQTQPGDVVLTASAWKLVQTECIGIQLTAGYVKLKALRDLLPLQSCPVRRIEPTLEPELRAYIPHAISARMSAGQTSWLAELRRVTVLFINLPDLCKPTTLDQAQAAILAIQTALYRYEGSINRLGIDDKGPTLVAAFGLPLCAHEDDAVRGVQAALSIQDVLNELGLYSAIGITTGQAFCTIVGNQKRCEYTMMGMPVNVSSRLMQAAAKMIHTKQIGFDNWQHNSTHHTRKRTILCDRTTYHAARDRLRFEQLPPYPLKGLIEPIEVYRPIDALPSSSFPSLPHSSLGMLLGRNYEHTALMEQLNLLQNHKKGSMVIIEGDVGIGKTRLIEYIQQRADIEGIPIWIGNGNAIEQLTPYYAWRQIFHQMFASIDNPTLLPFCELSLKAPFMEGMLGELHLNEEQWLYYHRFAPLLNDILPINLQENELTLHMSTQARAENITDLIIMLLQSVTKRFPGLIIIENAQWLDSASWLIIRDICRIIGPGMPLLLLIAMRTIDDTPARYYQQLRQLPHVRHLYLEGLQADDIQTLVSRRLGVSYVPQLVWKLIYEKSHGNPFFSEELAYMLRDNGLIHIHGDMCQVTTDVSDLSTIRLPDTIQSVIMSKIDRLSPAQQLTLKVASVIGAVVNVHLLHAVYPIEADRRYLTNYLATLQLAGIMTLITTEPHITYVFRHTIIRDVTYQLMSFEQRRSLHRAVAEWYEQTYVGETRHTSGNVTPYYPLLAYHWKKASVPAKAIAYLSQAGEHALTSGAYQEAINFFNQALLLAQSISQSNQTTVTQADTAPQSLPSHFRTTTWVAHAHWKRLLGEAYYGLGRLAESRDWLEQTLIILGTPPPATREQLIIGLLIQALQQCLYWIIPSFMLQQSAKTYHHITTAPQKDTEELWLFNSITCIPQIEAIRTYELLGRLYYYDNQLLHTLYTSLCGLNMAKRFGAASELARAYASMQVITGICRLRPLSKIYGRRAHQTARRVEHISEQIWVLQANCLLLISNGHWTRARTALEQILTLTEYLGDHRRWAENQALLALVYAYQGHFNQATQIYGNIHISAQHYGDIQVQTWGLIGQAENILPLGQIDLALSFLQEAESILTENLDRARAEEIWAYALLALAALRQGQYDLVRCTVNTALQLIKQVSPMAIYALAGYAGVAEIYLNLLETCQSQEERKQLAPAAHQACTRLTIFARAFPIAQPQAQLWCGLYAWIEGKPTQARDHWRRSIASATRLAMPYEQGRAYYEIGRHLTGTERKDYLTRAMTIFTRVGATYNLERMRTLLDS